MNIFAKDCIKKFEEYTKIDVRTFGEFMSSHIPGALHIDLETADFPDEILRLKKDKKYLVYCTNGDKSSKAVEEMKNKGFPNVFNLYGGVEEWQNCGYELVSGNF